ncbi:MAG TPA: CHAD domain-containing protein [Rhodopila sp.]|nr:CHAD domain-containing protein [Rhodopila sp.]
MEMEFALDADSAAGLARTRALTAQRDGRPRASAIRIVWHDSPNTTLRSAGLAVAEDRDGWRIERLVPEQETWLPAHPAPVLAHAAAAAELPGLPGSLAASLAPLAAFEGRHSTSVLVTDAGPVILSALRGTLRAVEAERPAARLWLSGAPPAVRAAMALAAGAAPITIPVATLAAEGIALATGEPPPARHLGPPALPDPTMPVQEALRHILGHLLDVVLAHAPAAGSDDERSTDAVHQMRVAVRRARSALSLFRPALPPDTFDQIRSRLKALGTQLGPRRDWDVFLHETISAVRGDLPDPEPLQRLAAAAERQQRNHRKALAAWLDSADYRLLTLDLAWYIAAIQEPPDPLPPLVEFAAGVLGQRHRKLISLGKQMDGLDPAGLHQVRLRAKRVRYAAEMFATLHPARPAHRFIKRLSVLQQRLGVLNDGTVAATLLAQLGGPTGRYAYAAGLITGFLAARAARMRPRVARAYEKFRRRPPYWC